MQRERDIGDFYKGGLLLRRWSWFVIVPAEAEVDADGTVTAPAVYGARCVDDPLDLMTATEEEIAAQLAANAEVRAKVKAAEPVPEPVEQPIYDTEGNQIGTRLVTPELPPPPPVERADYRTLRKLTYIREIGGTGDIVDGFGNAEDAQYWDRQGDPTRLAEVDATITAIKARYPKPETGLSG